ncbi:siderophore ABC transporter substrate-binding protein [Microbacterium sp. JB110]|uniref:siderophore ABC transporter substrate-binding protein n=1 Tax=Microbacterium sp. JB110 TaxID=2024477 RepID=UPI00097E9714|nr:ABC transporter substrate-binding protein [Microbacterium sp. JB110]RCS60422.1 iron ABC transporter substrate-binding protein [Microbacterium sp. JB110]SJM64953.1 Iron compound ABC transporter, periplasmic iron compound-binding protein [Frigoribacterium sp. JB110]
MALNRPLVTLSIVAASALALAGCASSNDADAASGDDGSGETIEFTFQQNVAGEDEEPEYVEETVDVPKSPESVVFFDMASLDTWAALGGPAAIGAPLDSVPDYLADGVADDAFNAGTLFEADLVEIEAAQPELIIVAGRSAALYEDLKGIAPTVNLSSEGSFEETLERNTAFLGEVLGAEDEAQAAIDDIEAQIEDVRAKTADIGTGLSVMVAGDSISALKPSDGDYSGRNLRGGLVYDVFGVQPITDDIEEATHGEPVSFEFLEDYDPDYLFVTDRNAAVAEEGAQTAEVVLDNEIVHSTTAWENDQIVYLDPTAWYIVFGGLETAQIMIDDIANAIS